MTTNVTPQSAFVSALHQARIRCAIYLPDSVFASVIPLIEADDDLVSYSVAREDEGVAVAAGAFLAGSLSIVMMEGSGVGMSGLILARAQIQRSPLVLAISHTRGGGEQFDYHGATRLVGQGVLDGLGIPHACVDHPDAIGPTIERAAMTARGQKTCFGVFFPPYVMRP